MYLFTVSSRLYPRPGDNLAQRIEQKALESHRQDLILVHASEPALSSLSLSFVFHMTGVITDTSESCQNAKASNIRHDI